MKIALLAPAGAMHRFSGSFGKSLHYAPTTLTLLAALIPEELNASVQIYDETIGEIPLDLDVDLIGITVITGTSTRSYRWADYYRSRGVTVVLGGVHPTLMPDEAIHHADAIVLGQAEQTWPQLLRDYRQGQLKKVYHQPEQITLAGRPVPRRDLFNKKQFITLNSLEATRGCVNGCSFCAVNATYGKVHYTRPIKEVITEIEQMPGREVLFVDVNLVADKEYAKKLFTEMVPLKRWWFGLSTADIVNDQELINLMVKSGCKGLLIGFESVSTSSLGAMNKTHNQGIDYHLLMKKLHSVGILVNGTFCLGTDEDDKDVFARTVEKIIELKIDLPRFSVMTPFPKTPVYWELEKQGRILERNWAMYDVQHCVFKPKNMTVDELNEGLAWAWEQTYKISSIVKRIGRFQRLLPISIASNWGYRNYSNKLKHFTREVMIDNSDIPAVEETQNESYLYTS